MVPVTLVVVTGPPADVVSPFSDTAAVAVLPTLTTTARSRVDAVGPAKIVAVPGETAVTTPVAETVAIVGLALM